MKTFTIGLLMMNFIFSVFAVPVQGKGVGSRPLDNKQGCGDQGQRISGHRDKANGHHGNDGVRLASDIVGLVGAGLNLFRPPHPLILTQPVVVQPVISSVAQPAVIVPASVVVTPAPVVLQCPVVLKRPLKPLKPLHPPRPRPHSSSKRHY